MRRTAATPALWIALANTLRARYFMHMAAKLGPAMYDSAINAAANGIQPRRRFHHGESGDRQPEPISGIRWRRSTRSSSSPAAR